MAVLLIVLLLSAVVRNLASSANFSQVEYEALYDLYTATGGDNWRWMPGAGKSWDFSVYEDPCVEQWQGINCTLNKQQNTSHVLRLLLPSFNLVGHLPESLGNFPMLRNLVLKNNSLSGSFPSCVGKLTSLQVLNMNRNAFSQSLPSSLGNLRQLSVLDFYINQLTGPVPEFLGEFYGLRYLDLYTNRFTGTIPELLGNLHILQFFYLGNNHFEGTLPSRLGNLNKVINFYVDQNHLHGTIPPELSNLQSVAYLFLYDNILSGGLTGLFDPNLQQNLSIVLLSDNEITGPLPAELFLLPNLTVIDVGSNCIMNDPLSDAICYSARLQTIAFDGLHTAPACRRKIPLGVTSTYLLSRALRHGVPDCIYSLPSLQTLHMSSNGLTGSLPENVHLGPNFTDLGISRNFLSGPLPDEFQRHHWSNLDLSYNKISGTLKPNFTVGTAEDRISLRVNRLSGRLPGSVIEAKGSLTVLEGNLFACKHDESDLPQNDQYVEQYQCGSNSFNMTYYVWLSLLFVILGGGVLLKARRSGVTFAAMLRNLIPNTYRAVDVMHLRLNLEQSASVLPPKPRTKSEAEVRGDDEDSDEEAEEKGVDPTMLKYHLGHFYRVCSMCKLLLRACGVLTTYILMVLLPLYGILSAYCGTFTHQYAYQLSLTFESGIEALVPCMFFLMIVPIIVYVSFVFVFRDHDAECNLFEREIEHGERLARIMNSTSSVDSTNTTVYLKRSKNLIYTALVLLNVVVVTGANLGFVMMVLYGNQTAVWMAQATLSVFKLGWSWVCSRAATRLDQLLDKHQVNLRNGIFSTLCVITIFNSIVVPCLIVLVVSSSCFYNVFVPNNLVESSYAYRECDDFDEQGCANEIVIVTNSSLSPPFVYSYQCAGTILTYYAPSFVYLCILQGLLIPFARWTIPIKLAYFSENNWFHRLLSRCAPPILKPVPAERGAKPSEKSPYFDARSFLVLIVNYLAVIMTFGVVFPPVAVSMAVTIVSSVFFTRLEIKKFMKDAASKGAIDFIDHVDKECMCIGTSAMLMHTIMLLVTMSCWFYSLFLFDILGDQVRLEGAYWVLLVMFFQPIFLYCVYELYIGNRFVRARLQLMAVLSGKPITSNNEVRVFQNTASPMVKDQHEVEMNTL